MHSRLLSSASAFALALLACSSATTDNSSGAAHAAPPTPCMTNAQCDGTTGKPICAVESKVCVAFPPGEEIGHRDGAATSVTFTEIYAPGAATKLSDVAYYEARDELWAVGYGDDSIHVGSAYGTAAASWKRIVDPATTHFMHKPPALAMGIPERWATCGDNANEHAAMSDGDLALFMGPSLFSTDMAVLGKRTANGLGSHEDMLHNTPLCRGIAHVSDNIYWVFNSYDSSLDYYDFHNDHGPGGDDHSDGEIYRYAAGKVKGVNEGTPSHVFFDPTDNFLYVSDTGNARVVRLDTSKGTKGAPLPRQMERIAANAMMDGTDVEIVVAAGTLKKPSGMEIHAGLIYVTDAETSTFHVFDKGGKEQRHLATGLPTGSLAGMTFGRDGKIYFADRVGGRILRIDPL